MDIAVPEPGEWPVDPQEDEPGIVDDRIWIDGCFDFFHHGHAGVMLQARQLGKELYVGIHSDEEILEHKGPTVMNLKERVSAAEACRWVTKPVPNAPYVTSLPWISHYGCRYVVHGDDISSDSNGEDCYRFVKQAGRFKVVKRTPGISTTDLVGRMLLCTRDHFIKSLKATLDGQEGSGTQEERSALADTMTMRIQAYASDESGSAPGVQVFTHGRQSSKAEFEELVGGKEPKSGQRIVYVDGGFDLFSSGHIEFLRSVVDLEARKARDHGWYTQESRAARLSKYGEDFGPAYVIAGIHDDGVINQWKGLNYPIMNIYERGLCLLQCKVSICTSRLQATLTTTPKYIHSVVFGAPFEPTEAFLRVLPFGLPNVVYHGPTSFIPLDYDPYKQARTLGIFEEVPRHDFQEVNAGQIVDRIAQSRARFEARQRAKGVKAVNEEEVKRREAQEAAQATQQ